MPSFFRRLTCPLNRISPADAWAEWPSLRMHSSFQTARILDCRCQAATGRPCVSREPSWLRSLPPALRLVRVVSPLAPGFASAPDATEPETRPPARPRRTLALSDDRFADLLAFVEPRLDTSLSTQLMANVARLSASYFHRAFVLRTGLTPHAWVMALRLKRAKELILGSSTSLTAIAADCGFFDQAHLTNTFRRTHGQSPNRWREEHAARRRRA